MTPKRPWLLPLVPLYRVAVGVRNRWYDGGGRTHALQCPVLSVGSVSAGGAGKTPFLAALARLLQQRGYAPDVLSRGYGRTSGGVLRVDPGGTAQDFGDEPLMLARALRVPVYVGSSRLAAGQLAEADLGAASQKSCVHLLDDGFSHRALARTLDIALLTLDDARDTLLPGGNLREPLAALRRADVLVLRAEEVAALLPLVQKITGMEKPIWTISRRLELPPDTTRRPVVFSAIARPGDFEAMVRAHGVEPAAVRRFDDHHAYTLAEIESLCHMGQQSLADGFLTTAKDAVKLTAPLRATLQRVGPVAVAQVVVEFERPDAVWADLEAVLRRSADGGN